MQRLVGARLPVSLPSHVCNQFARVQAEWVKRRPFLKRGKACANICVSFAAVGLKCDQNSQLAMLHSSDEDVAHQAKGVFDQMKALYEKHLHPIVMGYIPELFRPVYQLLSDHDVQLYVRHVSAVTAGELFWPRSHIDNDFCFTVLVVIDLGKGPLAGGDFSFPGMGWVLGLKHGDVVIYNPQHHHGTTEFMMDPIAGEDDSRVMFAFFMSKTTTWAAINSSVVHERRGPSKKFRAS